MKTKRVTVNDEFWKNYRSLVRTEMIPYQWKVLNDEININIERERDDDSIPNEKSHAMENFRIAAGLSKGEHYGWVFQDSDVYKWLEACAYSLSEQWDEDLKKTADEVVDIIAKAQEPDGYIGTYFTIMEPKRKFKRLLESHELYCAGHLIEACVAYYSATENEKALSVAEKLAGCIAENFGPQEGKIHGADGHEEIEIALMRLFHLTGKDEYRDLAEYFLMIRGQDPSFFKDQLKADGGAPLIKGVENFKPSYLQAHLPVMEQETAEGHAVRLVYLCTALADLAASKNDEALKAVCRRFWNNIVKRRMFITGGIGSTVAGEAFTLDYDLPNDTMYCETCASVGMVFFAKQMLRVEAKGEYADVMERVLYNSMLSGVALDGKHFFYVNPLEAVPEKSKKDPTKSHVKIVRPQWLGCACCPPNLARLVASVDDYIYTVQNDSILVNLFVQSKLECKAGGSDIVIEQQTDYPKSGSVSINITNKGDSPVRIGIRVPKWSDSVTAQISGALATVDPEDGYWYLIIEPGEHRIDYDIELKVKRWHANTKVSEDVRKVAIIRGPQVFCMEGVDNGEDLHCIFLPKDASLEYEWDDELLGGIGTIRTNGVRISSSIPDDGLYTDDEGCLSEKTVEVMLIPYYAWANRGENEMRVWVNE